MPREIERTRSFKRDYRREKSGVLGAKLDALLTEILKLLVVDAALPDRCKDHELSGDWRGYRECHIRPDLLLIYRKADACSLELARLGSHSQLFG